MQYDTAGNIIYEPIQNCDCGLTGGCEKCNPRDSFIGSITDKEAKEMKKKLAVFKKRFNKDFEEKLISTINANRQKPLYEERKNISTNSRLARKK